MYKDIFSNERRYRFGLTDSPRCDICDQIESVEHHLFSCQNAARLWTLYTRLTNQSINSLFDVLICGKDSFHEIVKSLILKALIQIDRSRNRTDREIISQCALFLRIEASSNKKCSLSLMREAERISLLP